MYNPFANSYTTMDVPCFYDPNNGRQTATNGKAIFSVAGELFVGKRMVQIISKEIEWSFPISENTNDRGNRGSPSSRKAQKSRCLDFEEKYMNSRKRPMNNHQTSSSSSSSSSSSNKRPANQENLDVEENMADRSTKRIIMLKDVVNAVNSTSVKGKERVDLTEDVNVGDEEVKSEKKICEEET